jgi:geranylgeranyl diphosphate synthase type I
VHTRFEAVHDEHALAGERRRFGEGIAILVGDFAVVYADVLLRATPVAGTALWDELRLELCVGQSLDLVGAARRSTDREFADRIARYKSAKYTVERPLHLGAALRGAFDDLRDPLSAIGLPLGAAFQLRDDILGVFGDAELTGKPVGDDLREGKPTLLVALAADRADADGRRQLARIGSPDLDEVEVKQLQELLVATEALRSVEHRIDDLVAEAFAAIDAAPIGADARHLLGELAGYVAWRDH